MSKKNNDDLLSPDVSPTGSKKSGVRSVNGRPMYILLAVIAAFLLIMAMVAADRAAKQNEKKDNTQTVNGNTSSFAKQVAGNQLAGFIPAAEAAIVPEAVIEEPVAEEPVALIQEPEIAQEIPVRPFNPDLPPVPPQNLNAQEVLYQPDPQAERIRLAKLQMLEEAIKAKTGVQSSAPRSSASASQFSPSQPGSRQEMANEIARVRQAIADNRSTDPTAAYQQRLAQIEAMKNESGTGTSSGNAGDNQLALLGQSLQTGSGNTGQTEDRWKLDSQIQEPRSPYELRAGFIIPSTLISGINSELPGQIVAQVAQNVFDTPTGNYLLIPQGSRLIGEYSSDVAYGQERVLIAWQRIVFPDGKALDIGAMPGADMAGYSGFHDQVNNHYFRIFASAILMSGITAGVTLSQNDSDDGDNSQRASDALSEALGQQLGDVAVEMIRKNMNIAPTLEIRPGYRFNVIVTKDMAFSKPYQSFDY